MEKKVWFGVLILLILAFLPIVNAGFNYANNNIAKSYSGGDKIKGKINISFQKEPVNSILNSNFEGEITLIELLKKNSFSEVKDYNCSTINCASQYIAKNQINDISLEPGERKIFGFKLSGRDIEIKSAKFSLSGNSAATCYGQFLIDTLDKNETYIQNYKYVGVPCGNRQYGCFDNSVENYDLATITSTPYCEKIKLVPAPAFQVGAKIKNSTQGSTNIKMQIYSNEWDELGKCNLPKHSQETEELKCIINFSNINIKEYYICVSSDTSKDYRIRSEQEGEICGNSDIDFNNYARDYEIFADALQFDTPNIEINETTFNKISGKRFAEYLDDYVSEKYDRACPIDGCIIPFEIIPEKMENLVISNAEIQYNAAGASGLSNSKIYLVEKTDSTIDSKYLDIELEHSGIKIPLGSRERKLALSLGGKMILPEPLDIKVSQSFEFDISQKFFLVGIDYKIEAITTEKIIASSWKFGDEKITNSLSKKISHKYLEEKEYLMEVELTREDGVKSSRVFKVRAGDAKTSSKAIVEQYDARIKDINSQIKNYSACLSKEIEDVLNISQLIDSLKKIKESYDYSEMADSLNRTNESHNYSEMLISLLKLKIPYSISTSESAKSSLSVVLGRINTDIIENISGEEFEEVDEEELRLRIINWTKENYDSEIKYDVISVYYEDKKEDIFTYFKIKLTPKNDEIEDSNLILNYPKEEIIFIKDYGETSSGDGTVITVPGNLEVEFLLPGKIELSELGIYVSPNINNLGVLGEIKKHVEESRFKSASWLIALVFFSTFVVYIILQEWYKRRYESYLFKNRDDLYNIVNFIYNSRIAKIEDRDIRKKLLGTNWSGERITYAFKKIDGRRTGMFEIPIFKFIENRKVKEEIERRQQRPVDARFIKRPYVY